MRIHIELTAKPVSNAQQIQMGSTGAFECSDEIQCNAISDSVVSYASAYIADAEETRIVRSSHNSFQNSTAIEFIVDKLSKRH